jgi:hypothetical protein
MGYRVYTWYDEYRFRNPNAVVSYAEMQRMKQEPILGGRPVDALGFRTYMLQQRQAHQEYIDETYIRGETPLWIRGQPETRSFQGVVPSERAEAARIAYVAAESRKTRSSYLAPYTDAVAGALNAAGAAIAGEAVIRGLIGMARPANRDRQP